MTKKRHSIDTIAEVLIDKLSNMEKVAKRIEIASSQVVEVDTAELRRLLSEHQNEQQTILRDLQIAQKKNQTRLPNWVLGVLGGFFLLFLGSTWFMISKAEKYDLNQNQARYYQEQFEACENSQKRR